MADLLYLDYNCFQRGFDDSSQARIRMEAAACEKIFEDAENGVVDVVWSFMHEDENALCPYVDRKLEIGRLSSVCRVEIGPGEEMKALAKRIEAAGLSAKDSVHLAAASCAKATAFLTCDDEVIRKAGRLPVAIAVMNPVQYVVKRG